MFDSQQKFYQFIKDCEETFVLEEEAPLYLQRPAIKQEELESPFQRQPDSVVDFHYNTEYRIAKEKRSGKTTQNAK